MTRLSFRLLTLSSVVTLAACGGGGGGSGLDSSNPLSAALQGSWVDGCDFDSDGGTIETITFSGSSITRAQLGHADRSCDEPELEIRFGGTFSLGETTDTTRGTQSEIDIVFNSLSMAILDPVLAAGLNTEEFCGINNWAIGVSFDVSDCTSLLAQSGTSLPSNLFDVVLVEGDELFSGIGDPGETVADRPTRVSAVATGTKQ